MLLSCGKLICTPMPETQAESRDYKEHFIKAQRQVHASDGLLLDIIKRESLIEYSFIMFYIYV